MSLTFVAVYVCMYLSTFSLFSLFKAIIIEVTFKHQVLKKKSMRLLGFELALAPFLTVAEIAMYVDITTPYSALLLLQVSSC